MTCYENRRVAKFVTCLGKRPSDIYECLAECRSFIESAWNTLSCDSPFAAFADLFICPRLATSLGMYWSSRHWLGKLIDPKFIQRCLDVRLSHILDLIVAGLKRMASCWSEGAVIEILCGLDNLSKFACSEPYIYIFLGKDLPCTADYEVLRSVARSAAEIYLGIDACN